MGKQRTCIIRAVYQVLSVLLLPAVILLSACAEPEVTEPAQTGAVTGLPAEVKTDQLQPGLAVIYYHDKYRHIKQMPKGDHIMKYAHPGPPVLKLDHKFGRGKVFDSGRSESVGMLMTGFLHLEKPGMYQFQAISNDGFRMFIDEKMIIDEPTVHLDKLSEPGQYIVREGGWFPVTLKYFQRKGTATLQLFWQPPGSSDFTVIPETVYFHRP